VKAEKTPEGRGSPVVRNLPKEFSVTVSILRLIILSREPAVLAYHPGKLTVSANPGKLRRQPGAGTQMLLRNLPLLIIGATSLAANGSDIPPQ
jgi:hypothetical protein